MTTGFFLLPVELRLQVYGHLVATSMANGTTTGIAGLMISCHEVYHEMNTNCIAKIRPLLKAMSACVAAQPSGDPLFFELPLGYGFVKRPTQIILSILTPRPIKTFDGNSSIRTRSTFASRVSHGLTFHPELSMDYSHSLHAFLGGSRRP